MANELILAAMASFVKGNKRVTFNKGSVQHDVAGTDYIQTTQIAVVSPGAALDKGNITALGLFIGRNNDATNTIYILTAAVASSGVNAISIPPLKTVMFFFGTGVTAPVILSSASTAELEYLIVEA